MTLDSLSPEELAALEEAISKRKESMSKPDPIAELKGVVQMLVEKVGRIETDFYEKVLGGIDGLYKENLRADGLKAFGEKHGSMFSPFADDFKRVFDKDLIPMVFDYLEELKGEPGFNDEVGGTKLKELADQIKGRIGPKEEPPAAVEVTKVEAEKPPEPPPDEGPSDGIDASMENEIAAMKRKEQARDSAHEKARSKGAA
jgi:hypothetical protein